MSAHKITKAAPWHLIDPNDPDNEFASAALRITDRGVTIMEALAISEESKNEDQIFTMVTETSRFTGTSLIVIIPGLCGHYGCGDAARISLN